jgi:hypothetical protein
MAAMLLTLPPAVSAAESAQDSDLPSLDFLEFLGSFETDSGQWVDPAELMQPDFEQLLENIGSTPIQASGVHEQDNSANTENGDGEDEV